MSDIEVVVIQTDDRDPMEPDYEALSKEPVRSARLDSADAAGYYTPMGRIHRHGLDEEDWEEADYYHDMMRDGQ